MLKKPNNGSALLLAAGASSRMGRPKPFLHVGNRTLLEDQVNRLDHAGCLPIIVVVGSDADEIMEHHKKLNVIWIINHEWERGHFSSILCGLKKMTGAAQQLLPAKAPLINRLSRKELAEQPSPHKQEESCAADLATLLLPIDTIGVPIETISQILMKGLHEDRNIVPTFENRGGHPVFLTNRFIQHVLKTATPDNRLDHLLNADPNTLRIEACSDAILNNVNTMNDWNRLSLEPIK